LLACAFCAFPAAAAESRYDIQSHSYAEFALSHLGLSTFRGKITRVSGKISMDPEAGTGAIDVTLDAGAIVTGDAAVERVLRGEGFFNVDQFPAMHFVASKLSFADGKLQQVQGELTLLGVTKPVTLTVDGYACTKNFFTLFRYTCGADAKSTIRRSDFGMTRYVPLIGDEVNLNLAVEATTQEPAPAQPSGDK